MPEVKSRKAAASKSPAAGATEPSRSVAGEAQKPALRKIAPPASIPVPATAGEAVGRDLGHLKQVIGFRFRRIQNHLSRRLVQMPEFKGGKSGELSALAIISANPGLSQIDLASEVGLDKAMVVVVIDDLERLGLARRERAPEDRRRNLLFVTPKGEETLEHWIALARENEKPVRDALSEAEFQQLSGLLDRIYNQCFNHEED